MTEEKSVDKPDVVEADAPEHSVASEEKKIIYDAFFATSHISFHHQPDEDPDEPFMGE